MPKTTRVPPTKENKTMKTKDASGLSAEKVAQAKDEFHFFDKDRDGLVDIDQTTAILRSLGYNPTDSEINNLLKRLFSDKEQLEFDNFLEVLSRVQKWGDTPDEILDAFMTFDENRNGMVSTSLLYEVLTTRGEQPMTSKEVKQMIEHVTVNEMGEIDYRELIDVMLSV